MPIPETFKPLWEALYNEVVAVHARWVQYEMLFGESPVRVKTLYQHAPVFFYILQTTLIDDVQLTLGRLGDPAETRGRENATLNTLLCEITALGDAEFTNGFKERMTRLEAACFQIRQRRNKLIAHYDRGALLQQYAFATGESAAPPDVSQPTRDEIKTALQELSALMNFIEFHYTGTSTAYSMFRRADGAGSLVWMIKCGLRYVELLRSGVIPQENLYRIEAYRW